MKEYAATYPSVQAVEKARDLSTVSCAPNLCGSERNMIGVPFPGKMANRASGNREKTRTSPQSRRRPRCSPRERVCLVPTQLAWAASDHLCPVLVTALLITAPGNGRDKKCRVLQVENPS